MSGNKIVCRGNQLVERKCVTCREIKGLCEWV